MGLLWSMAALLWGIGQCHSCCALLHSMRAVGGVTLAVHRENIVLLGLVDILSPSVLCYIAFGAGRDTRFVHCPVAWVRGL